MKLLITGGGTGGHTMPAVSIGLLARDRGAKVVYIGSGRGNDGRVADRHGLRFHALDVAPLGRPYSLAGARSILKFVRARRVARHLLVEESPDVVFGTGGYASAAVMSAQLALRGPAVLHEQNTIPGRVNRRIGRQCNLVCLTFDEAAAFFPNGRTELTGLPLRPEATKTPLGIAEARVRFGLKPEKFTALVVGGSQGAAGLNETVLATVQRLPLQTVQWLHVCGEKHADTIRRCADRIGLNGNYVVWSYLEGGDVATAFRAADMVVCRAGASTLVETAFWSLPCVFVPYPHAFADHQRRNAEYLTKRGAGELIDQGALSPERLATAIDTWRENEASRIETGNRAHALFNYDASERILGLLERVAGKQHRTAASAGG